MALLLVAGGGAQSQETTDLPSPDVTVSILIVDIAQVRSRATAYLSIREETERGRDLINAVYQQRLAGLQTRSDDLTDLELSLTSDSFQQQVAALEREAIELETRRRQNFAALESLRQEASAAVDVELNAVLAILLGNHSAFYILNQQSALVWPEAANVTTEAIDLLNERLPSVNFEINIRQDGAPEQQNR